MQDGSRVHRLQERVLRSIQSRPITTVLIVGVLSLGVGLAIDVPNFFVGLLASIAALALTIWTATFIFDEFAEKQATMRRRKKWDVVRVATLAALWDQIRRLTLPITERCPEGAYFSVSYDRTLKIMDGVLQWIPTQAVSFDRTDTKGVVKYEECKADIARMYGEVAREYVYIRDVLTPRVFDLADDVDLTGLLFALDDMERQWSSVVFTAGPGETENAWQEFPVTAWNAVCDFYRAAIGIAQKVASAPDILPSRGLELVPVNINGEWVHRSRVIRGESYGG